MRGLPGILGLVLLAAVAITAMVVGAAFRSDVTRARARVAAGSQVITTACGPIEYGETGSGPVILMIHGSGGGFDQGLALADSFAPEGYRVIAPSRFGYLRTPLREGASPALQADAHACLLDALGVRDAVVVGVSAGASSAMEFALRHADRSKALILVVPGWFPTAPSAAQRVGPMAQKVMDWAMGSDFIFWAFAKAFPSVATRAVLATPPGVVAAASAADQASVRKVLWDILPISARSVGLSREAEWTTAPLSKPLDQLQLPALVISARDDLYGTWKNAEFIRQRIPGCQRLGFDTGGHLLVGHGEAVRSGIAGFLAASEPAPGA